MIVFLGVFLPPLPMGRTARGPYVLSWCIVGGTEEILGPRRLLLGENTTPTQRTSLYAYYYSGVNLLQRKLLYKKRAIKYSKAIKFVFTAYFFVLNVLEVYSSGHLL